MRRLLAMTLPYPQRFRLAISSSTKITAWAAMTA